MPVVYFLATLWALWYLYLIVMGLYRAKLLGKLSPGAMVLGAPALIVGTVMDWFLNVLASVVFREWPRTRKELLTTRLTRYINGPQCQNKHWAGIICRHLLDPFDPMGSHCRQTKDYS
ncbi:MAG: hypothetical protein WC829_09850 [Hyphomicrobium sp.]|jgi:hypothetical protein